MGYQDIYQEMNEQVEERFALVAERVDEIEKNAETSEPYAAYFRKTAGFLTQLAEIRQKDASGELAGMSMEECEAQNAALYQDILPEHYGESYANPAYAVSVLGEEFGAALSLLAAHIRGVIREVFRGNLTEPLIAMELFVEI